MIKDLTLPRRARGQPTRLASFLMTPFLTFSLNRLCFLNGDRQFWLPNCLIDADELQGHGNRQTSAVHGFAKRTATVGTQTQDESIDALQGELIKNLSNVGRGAAIACLIFNQASGR